MFFYKKCKCKHIKYLGKFYRIYRPVFINENSGVTTFIKTQCLDCGQTKNVVLDYYPVSCHRVDIEEAIEEYIKKLRNKDFVSEREINEKIIMKNIEE